MCLCMERLCVYIWSVVVCVCECVCMYGVCVRVCVGFVMCGWVF